MNSPTNSVTAILSPETGRRWSESGRPRKMQVVVVDVAEIQRRPQIDTRYSSLCLKRGIVPKGPFTAAAAVLLL